MAKPSKNMSATWNRDDRDLLVELRTEMAGMRADMNDIKGNFSNRLLNLEGNVVMKLVYDQDVRDRAKYREDTDIRFRNLETGHTQVKTYGAVALIALGIIEFIIGKFF